MFLFDELIYTYYIVYINLLLFLIFELVFFKSDIFTCPFGFELIFKYFALYITKTPFQIGYHIRSAWKKQKKNTFEQYSKNRAVINII
jgi:hypothetical protein